MEILAVKTIHLLQYVLITVDQTITVCPRTSDESSLRKVHGQNLDTFRAFFHITALIQEHKIAHCLHL